MNFDELKRAYDALLNENQDLRGKLRDSEKNAERLGQQNNDLCDVNFELERALAKARGSKAA